MSGEWETCNRGHRCCETIALHSHDWPADECTDCAAMGDPLVASVDDECPTCGAYMLNPELHKTWHAGLAGLLVTIDRKADSYVPPPTYGGLR